MTGNTFDDAASAQGILNFFARALNSGALTEQEIFAAGRFVGSGTALEFVFADYGKNEEKKRRNNFSANVKYSGGNSIKIVIHFPKSCFENSSVVGNISPNCKFHISHF